MARCYADRTPRNRIVRAMSATATSWKCIPFEAGVPLSYAATFDSHQADRLIVGLIPREMEDKWFIYYERPCLFGSSAKSVGELRLG